MAIRRKNQLMPTQQTTLTQTSTTAAPRSTTAVPRTGGTQTPEATAPAGVPPPAVPPPAGADPTKWANAEHQSPKYQVLRTLAGQDLSMGLTPEMINSLNALGLGTFTQIGKDKVSISGDVDPRWGGVTTLDLIKDFNSGNPTLQFLTNLDQQGGSAGQGVNLPALSSLSTSPSLSALSGGSAGSGGSGGGIPPKPAPDWVWTGSGWVPPDHPLAANAQPDPTSGGSGGSGGGSSSTTPLLSDELIPIILDLLDTGGRRNTQIIDQRTESARENLERARNAEMQTLDAVLADRGLTGSGADIEARALLGDRLGSQHATTLRDIHAEENRAADARMMQALVTGAGLSVEQAQDAIDWFNAQTGRYTAETGRIGTEGGLANERARIDLSRLLGLGELGLGQAQLEANYNLGLGRLGLDQALGFLGVQNNWVQQLLQLLGPGAGAQTPSY